MLKKVPHTYTIVFSIIIICAILTWIIPGGEYARETVDVNGVERTVIVNDSFHEVAKKPANVAGVFGPFQRIRETSRNYRFYPNHRGCFLDHE